MSAEPNENLANTSICYFRKSFQHIFPSTIETRNCVASFKSTPEEECETLLFVLNAQLTGVENIHELATCSACFKRNHLKLCMFLKDIMFDKMSSLCKYVVFHKGTFTCLK